MKKQTYNESHSSLHSEMQNVKILFSVDTELILSVRTDLVKVLFSVDTELTLSVRTDITRDILSKVYRGRKRLTDSICFLYITRCRSPPSTLMIQKQVNYILMLQNYASKRLYSDDTEVGESYSDVKQCLQFAIASKFIKRIAFNKLMCYEQLLIAPPDGFVGTNVDCFNKRLFLHRID